MCHRTSVATHGQCHIHIKFFCFVAMFGRSSCVQVLDVLEVPYRVAIVLTLFFSRAVDSPVSHNLNGSFQENKCFYTLLWCHQALFWCYDVIFQQSDWLKRAQSCHLVGISLFSPHFSVQKGQFCSRLWRERMCILAQFWVECIRLAQLVSSGESTRHFLIDELAAGKSPYISTYFHFSVTWSSIVLQCSIM